MAATVYYRQGLDGGGATDLDNIAGSTLNDNDIAFVMTGTAFYVYKVDANSGATQSLPDVVEPNTPDANERWILQTVQNVQALEYENITSSTSLAVGKRYNDSSGTNLHTLPSSASAGESLELYVTGASNRDVEIQTAAAATFWESWKAGDHVNIVYNGTDWVIVRESERLNYSGIAAATALHPNFMYNDYSGSHTHTLPGSADLGDTIEVHMTQATDRTVVVNNSSAQEKWTGYQEGDYAKFRWTGSAWYVIEEKSTIEVMLALTSNEVISAAGNPKIFDAGYSERRDTAAAWNTTTDRFTAQCDGYYEFGCHILTEIDSTLPSNGQNLSPEIRVNGGSVITGGTYTGDLGTWWYYLADGDYVEFYARNGASVALRAMGDAAFDESRAHIRLIRRVR